MFSQLVGQVDSNAAGVLAVAFICIAVITTALIVKRRSRLSIDNDYKLAVMQKEIDDKQMQYKLETTRGVEFKKLEQNLITSHRETNNGDD